MALTTANRVRQRLGIASDSGGINDTEITSLIAEMEAALKSWCDVLVFESSEANYDATHNGGYDTIALRANYADSVAVALIRDDGTEQVYPPSLYRLDKATATIIHARRNPFDFGTERTDGCFPRGYRNIRVTGTAGYTVLPDDLVFAATEMVKDALLSRLNNSTVGQTAQSGTTIQRRTFVEQIEERAWLLSKWKRVRV